MFDLAEEYLLVCEADGFTPATINQKRQLLKQFFRYCESKDVDDVDDITSSFLRKWVIHEKETCKAITINGKIQMIRPFFNWLVEEEIIEKNPWKQIRLLKCNPPIIQAYDRKDIDRMLSYYKGNKFMPVRNRTIITILAETGIRNSEMRNIKLEDLSDNAIRILGKGNKVRYVPISKILKLQLMKYLRIRKEYLGDVESDLLFISRLRRPVTRFALLKLIKEMGEALEINVDNTIHNFRRFYMQEMIKNVDIYTLAKTVGHSKITTTQRYLESIVDEKILERASKYSPLSGGKTK